MTTICSGTSRRALALVAALVLGVATLAGAIVESSVVGPSASAATAGVPSNFVGVTPTRIFDTRSTNAPTMAPGATRNVQIGGVNGIPSVASGLTSVVLNVTVTNPSGSGFLTLFPEDQPNPGVSNVNFVPGQTVPNLVTVNVSTSPDGWISVYNFQGSTDVIIDVFGYYTTGPGSRFHGMTPVRLLDTRPNSAFGPGVQRSLAVSAAAGGSSDGVPSGATAVVLNVTVTQPSAPGFLSIFPGNVSTPPGNSNLNFVPGLTVANLVVVQVPISGPGAGMVNIYNFAGSTHVIVDIVDYYDGDASNGGQFVAVTPTRLVDTRQCPGLPMNSGGGYELDILGGASGQSCQPTSPIGSSNVVGVVGNITATAPTLSGFLSVFPGNIAWPGTSTLNFVAGQSVANMVMVGVPGGTPSSTPCTGNSGGTWAGCVAIFNYQGLTHVIADVSGYFTGP